MKNKKILIIIILIVLIIAAASTIIIINNKKKAEEKEKIVLTQRIKSHYSKYVTINKETNLYQLKNNEYIKNGKIGKDEILELTVENVNYNTKYFKTNILDDIYYIKYEDVTPYNKEIITNERYKKYIPFNENIITNETTNFYNKDNSLAYSINKSLTLPIIIKYDSDTYGVEYNNRLLKVKKTDIKEIKEHKNADKTKTNEIAVVNYHFFYDDSNPKEIADCRQEICHPKSLVKEHFKYIKDNNIFTPTIEEYSLFLDNKINLPKSILITIDDGWRMQIGIDLLQEYKLNGTVFLITSWWPKDINFLNDYEYVEFHSHGDNLHNQGVCPGGQGGAIKCLEKSKLLADLALSKKKLNGSTIFCYPFYEYNNYSIEVLKEAGYTMAFGYGFRRSKPGENKYTIPRYVMTNTTSVAELKSYIG